LISIGSGFIGGLIGILLGSAISIVALEISLAQILTFQLSAYLILLAIGITFLIGIISSNLTLYRILKIPISNAIKEILPETK
jgi:ABC-type antimicrobial peptide transport system permease subunit